MDDAIDDSDDEVDYTKMDLGNKKGPIGKFNSYDSIPLHFTKTMSLSQVAGISIRRKNIRTI